MRKLIFFTGFLLVFCRPPAPLAEEGDTGRPYVRLTLHAAVLLTLANNIDIKIERLQPEIAETEIEAQESVFDPTLTTNLSEGSAKRQSEVATFLTGNAEPFQNAVNVNAGVQKRFSTGTTAQLEVDNNRISSNSFVQRFNPSWDTALTLSVIQPLLKDFGREFNLGQVVIAKNNRSISDIQFRQRVIDIVTAVKQTYWDLVQAIELLDVSEQSVRLAQELLEINQAKVEAGQLAPIDVVEAEAGVAAREEAVILAEDRIHDLEDRLKDLLNPGEGSPLEVPTILPIDRPTDAERRFSARKELETALENRPDYLRIKTELENRLVGVKLARNQIRPRVDLVASAGVTGLGPGYGDAVEEADGDFYDLRIGLRFEYPLGNRAARSQFVRSKIEQQQVELRITDLEKRIALQVREAVRQVETDFKRIQTTRVARRLAEKKLEAEQAKFEVGISTTKDVLDFQVDLALARSRESAALTDYNKSLLALYQTLGTTLRESGITTQMLESG
jgi:outer membrane protein TolC